MTTEELLAANARLEAELASSRAVVRKLTAQLERLTRQLDLLLARLGEAPLPGVGDPAAPGPSSPSGSATPEKRVPAPDKPPKRIHAHGRGPLPAGLARDTVVVPTPEVCPSCGGTSLRIVESVENEQYDYVRAHVRVRRIIRKVCRCNHCLQRVTPPLPPMPFERASCTNEMVAWVLYAKCSLHLPLDRQRNEFALQGAPISSAMITRWFAQGADLLMPIVGSLRLELLSRRHIRCDGTGLAVLAVDQEGQPLITGQVVVFCTPETAVYHYAPSKHGSHIEDWLTLDTIVEGKNVRVRWEGTLTADAASVHDRLFADGTITESGCNAHGLRKFRDDADKAPLLADTAMSFIGTFYKVEQDARDDGLTGGPLLQRRRERALPVAERFKGWIDEHVDDLLPKNPVRQALQYYRNHWGALTRFLLDPSVPLDNNLSERLVKPLALGRKAWLFAGGEQGARRVCAVLSLVSTCKLLGLDPYDYLVWALQRVEPHPDNRGLRANDLTPHAYKKRLQQADADEGFA